MVDSLRDVPTGAAHLASIFLFAVAILNEQMGWLKGNGLALVVGSFSTWCLTTCSAIVLIEP